jgi:DNA-binding transcriptional ArsR family regulator
MSKKYITFDLDDERIDRLADVISNKTSKKILEYLADKEASETEIARDLNLPANTVNYNVKNLLETGLIEKTKDFLWSVKGKKILKYKVANKRIVISPKSSKNIIPVFGAFIATIILAFGIRIFTYNLNVGNMSFDKNVQLTESSGQVASSIDMGGRIVSQFAGLDLNLWLWFLLGGIFALLIYVLLSWRKL